MAMCFLPEDSMIAGTKKIMDFEYYTEEGGTTITLPYAKVVFCPYGEYSKTVLEKIGTIIDSNVFRIILTQADTNGLSGVYTFQPIVIDSSGYRCRPTEGNIVITPAISASQF